MVDDFDSAIWIPHGEEEIKKESVVNDFDSTI